MPVKYEICHLCDEYFIPSNEEMRIQRETDGDWTCPDCQERLARESARPFNMDYDYQEVQ